ncbi:MAG: pacearchaeosortase [Candidatus Pacearchaeota archaeon]|jgi:exosortase/archaeosortase family protein
MKEKKPYLNLIIRYLILVIVGFFGFNLFYFIFLPLTVYPTFFLLNLFYNPSLIENTIFVNGIAIEIIGACIAGSAYSFLLILNLSVPNIKTKKRIEMILLSFGIFFAINLIRIFVLSLMNISDSSWFDFTHKLFWYLGSTLFVILIWFLEVKMFKIKEIPVYSDLKFLYKKSLLNKKKNKK